MPSADNAIEDTLKLIRIAATSSFDVIPPIETGPHEGKAPATASPGCESTFVMAPRVRPGIIGRQRVPRGTAHAIYVCMPA